MIYQVKCIEKIRDKNNHIIEYKLIDSNRKIITIKSDKLKEAIKSEQLEITNLTLTSDSRLIDKKVDTSKPTVTPSKQINNSNTENLFNRAKILGYTIKTFDTECWHRCYIASSQDNKNTF